MRAKQTSILFSCLLSVLRTDLDSGSIGLRGLAHLPNERTSMFVLAKHNTVRRAGFGDPARLKQREK